MSSQNAKPASQAEQQAVSTGKASKVATAKTTKPATAAPAASTPAKTPEAPAAEVVIDTAIAEVIEGSVDPLAELLRSPGTVLNPMFVLAITLDTTCSIPALADADPKAIKNLSAGGFSLYNPLRKAKAEEGQLDGIIRPVLSRLLSQINSLNSTTLMIAGKANDRSRVEADVASAMLERGVQQLAVPLTAEVEGIELPEGVKLTVSDFIKYNSWVSHEVEEGEVFSIAVLQLRVFAPVLLQAKSSVQFVRSFVGRLNAIIERDSLAQVQVLAQVALSTEALATAAARDVLCNLIDEDGFDLYGINGLETQLGRGFVPPTKVGIKNALGNNDILLSTSLTSPEVEESDEEAADD